MDDAGRGHPVPKSLDALYHSSGGFVLRSPLFPAVTFRGWAARGTDIPARREPEGKAERLRRILTRCLSDGAAEDALRIASPTVWRTLGKWLARGPSRRKDRMERTLVQYFARMCDRCTPFGLFAGVSVGRVGGEVGLRLAGRDRYRRRSTLDLGQVRRLVGVLMRDPAVRDRVRYRPNDTLAWVGGRYQYVEHGDRDGAVFHEVASLDPDEALETVLRHAAAGARLSELERAVAVTVPDADETDCREYVKELVEVQVIQPDLVPSVVGPDPLDQILGVLTGEPGLEKPARRVRRLRRRLQDLDAHGVGASPEAYAAVERVWTEDLGLKRSDHLLQVDLLKERKDLRLPQDVVAEVLRGADPLWRLAGPAGDELTDLKRRFRERYEGREVPLAEVFDPEVGLGAPGRDLRPLAAQPPVLRDLALGSRGGAEGKGRGNFTEIVGSRLLDRGRLAREPLELDDKLLEQLAHGEPPALPDALGMHFELVAGSEDAVRRGDYRVLYHATAGPSGARMLGRFCDLDRELLAGVRRHLTEEAALDPDAIFAEIVHTPEGRIGNVVRRPHVREVELSVGGNSRRFGETRLTVEDLLLSLEGNRFRLRSRRNGRRVVPRLTSAHNFRRSTGLYRFLGALQNDGVQVGFGWGWGALASMNFLPRVVRGRWIYALARWRLSRDRPSYAAIGKAKSRRTRRRAAERLVGELELSRFVRLADGDNRLLLDLDNPLCLSVLADHAARRPALTLEEVLDEDLEGCVSGPEGKFRHEIILPVVRRKATVREAIDSRRKRRVSSASDVPRVFPPGSGWLYFKLYGAHGTVDRLLGEVAAPLADLHGQLAPERPWFFIRYEDPDHHLRLRFRCARDARRDIKDRMAEITGRLVEQGSLHRLVLDTYRREVERYGGSRGVELAEEWFRWDSEAALSVIGIVEASGDEDLRWRAALMGTDRLLADFGLGLRERERLVAKAREGYGKEFRVGAPARRRLAQRLRRERSAVEAVVTGSVGSGPLAEIEAVFRRRSARTAETVATIRRLEKEGGLECSLDDLLRSFAHMHANRLLPVSARAQELVIHDFLGRTYRSLVARRRR